jgi:hypothetical protein
MTVLTPGERQVLLLLLFLVVSGLAGKAWIRTHPSTLAPFPPQSRTASNSA